MARAFSQNSATIDIRLKAVLDESPRSMTTVESYHAPDCRAYNVIRAESPSLDSDAALQTAVKAVNESIEPNGLIPILLVYGVLSRREFSTYLSSP